MTESSATPSLPPHSRCNCVPDLGPAHCHRCSQKMGKNTPWSDADCAVFVDAFEGLVDVHADGVAEAIDLLITRRLPAQEPAHRPIPAPKPAPTRTPTSEQPKNSTVTPSSITKTSPLLMKDRPASAGWTFTNLAITQLDELQVDMDEVVRRAKAAPVTMPSADGNARNHYHDDLLILVDGTCVISVVKNETSGGEPVVPQTGGSDRTRRRKKISGGPGRKMPGSTRDLCRMLEKKGFTVERQPNNHLRVTHPDHPDALFVIASSPSDHHSTKNSIAEIRKTTGIDITQS